MLVGIIDYGLGNLRSVAAACIKLGYTPKISNSMGDIKRADKLILPGVGAFHDGMKNLKELKIVEPLKEAVRGGKPILGICLGFQLMAKESFEFGHHEGLGWIDASVHKIEPGDKNLPVPHVGWNDLMQTKQNILFEGIPCDALFYYVHSFHVVCEDKNDIIGECDYGMRLVAAIQHGNIYGTQFHPEKSQYYGLALLKNFIEKT